ncbi:T9SS type A sorting domain-containing protein [candidate division KSB1 bacterium]|nr:T9SS type A sorting domain-containing protein [candidate division KSB1 bacterium]
MSWPSMHSFLDSLTATAMIEDASLRRQRLDLLWQTLQTEQRIPFSVGDSVAFLYRGQADSVHWNGDFNRWGGDRTWNNRGGRVGLSDVWLLLASFPADARLDYKIVLNGNQWILDPANAFVQWGGYGPNSELRMPLWVYPRETNRQDGIPQGVLSSILNLDSSFLGYRVNIRVYTPANVPDSQDLPVLYVTDGHEYADSRLGSLPIVLDNLIGTGRIEPVRAVFIDPRNPANPGQNRRMQEYNLNPRFADFVALELVAYIDSTYHTRATAENRAVLGTSMGGLFAAYLGVRHPDRFHLLGIQSPAFAYNHQIYALYAGGDQLPLKIHMTTGVINDTRDAAREMKRILENKGYAFAYREVNESHSWGNWRALLDEMLLHFWGSESAVGNAADFENSRPATFHLRGNYPNPFNHQTVIEFSVHQGQSLRLELYDLLGRRVQTVFHQRHFSPGLYRTPVDAEGLAGGIYLYALSGAAERRIGRLALIR